MQPRVLAVLQEDARREGRLLCANRLFFFLTFTLCSSPSVAAYCLLLVAVDKRVHVCIGICSDVRVCVFVRFLVSTCLPPPEITRYQP